MSPEIVLDRLGADDNHKSNIKGNDYRLIAIVNYQANVVAIRFFETHSEYDRIDAGTI
jgi:mRNA interferase HigB